MSSSDLGHAPLVGPLVLFFGGAVVGLMPAYNPPDVPLLLTLAGGALLYCVCYCTCHRWAWTASTRRGHKSTATTPFLPAILVACTALFALYFISQYGHLAYAPKSAWIHAVGRSIARLTPRLGTWQPHPNFVAAFLEGSVPMGLAGLLAARRLSGRLLWGTGTVLIGLGLLLTVSRGAWVALAAILGLAVVLRWPAVRGWAAVLAIGGLLLAGAGILLLDDWHTVVPWMSGLLVRPDRWTVWQGAFQLVRDFPFTGIGLGRSFAMIYSRYVLLIPQLYLTYSHNLWLEVWLRQGLPGIIGFCWLIVALYLLVWRTVRTKGAAASPFFHGAWLGITVILGHGLVDAAQYAAPWTWLSFFVLLGLVAGLAHTDAPRIAARAHAVPRGYRWVWVAAACSLVLGGLVSWRVWVGMAYVNRGALRQAHAELSENLPETRRAELLALAYADYERACALNPASQAAHRRLGVLDTAAGHYDAAVAHLQVAYERAPQNTTTRKALGLAHLWIGSLDSAEPLLRDLPGIVKDLNDAGWYHQQRQDPTLAQYAYQMSLRLDPDQAQLRRSLAELQKQ